MTQLNTQATISQVQVPEGWARGLPDEGLLVSLDTVKTIQETNSRQRDELEAEIIRRAQERHANGIPSDIYACTIETPATYSQAGFGPLREVFNEGDLATVMVPAHEETTQVPDQWQTVKVIALAKRYGSLAMRLVDSARVEGRPRVKLTKKKAGNAA